jgi:hypothetical protein
VGLGPPPIDTMLSRRARSNGIDRCPECCQARYRAS